MKLLFIIFCWFTCQSALSARVLWQGRRNSTWMREDRYTGLVLALALLALTAAMAWGLLVLNWWEVPVSIFWGFIAAYLIYLWIKDNQARLAILISNVAMIVTALLLWSFYFELIPAGPYSQYFGRERLAVFEPGRNPNLPSMDQFKEFGDALGHATACGLANSEFVNALERMGDGLEITYKAGGLTEEEANDIRGEMMTKWAQAWVGQETYKDKINCGEAISKWNKMKKIMPL